MSFAYTVIANFSDPALVDRYLAWLQREHLADVCAAGAESAEVVRIDGDKAQLEVRYRFSSRAAYDAYLRDHAPRLRAAGLALFPPESGLSYQRTSGEIVAAWP